MAKSFLTRTDLPRGLRNNNPGNLKTGIEWQGAIGNDGTFLIFDNIAYGLRAMSLDVGNDIRLKGLNTIRKLITEYAPPSENNTAAYINAVSASTGWSADQLIPHNMTALLKLIRAILKVELGTNYHSLITDQDIQEGLAMLPVAVKQYFNIDTEGSSFAPNWIGLLLVAGLAYFAYQAWAGPKKMF